jgi:hypothetical protein
MSEQGPVTVLYLLSDPVCVLQQNTVIQLQCQAGRNVRVKEVIRVTCTRVEAFCLSAPYDHLPMTFLYTYNNECEGKRTSSSQSNHSVIVFSKTEKVLHNNTIFKFRIKLQTVPEKHRQIANKRGAFYNGSTMTPDKCDVGSLTMTQIKL